MVNKVFEKLLDIRIVDHLEESGLFSAFKDVLVFSTNSTSSDSCIL